MREESHLDDMRSAIRGDFERLAERRGDQQLLRVSEVEEAESTSAADDDGERTSSWLARFLSPGERRTQV